MTDQQNPVIYYCTFDDSDVLVFESEEVYTVSIASMRRVAGFPPPVDLSTPQSIEETYQARIEWLANNSGDGSFVEIDHPEAGNTYQFYTKKECVAKLNSLRSDGLTIPQSVFDLIIGVN